MNCLFVQFIYRCIFSVGGLLILVTLLWDLGFALPRGFGQLDLKLEGNLAVWYSSALLLITGAAALLIGFSRPPLGVRPTLYRLTWVTGALFFIGLSVDETNEFHERLGRWFTYRFGAVPGLTDGGYAVFAWVVVLLPFIALFIIGAIGVIRSWLKVHRNSRNLAVAALCCWIGVICAEVIEVQMLESWKDRSVQGVVEEGLEIAGSALFFVAFCEFLRRQETAAVNTRRSDPLDSSSE